MLTCIRIPFCAVHLPGAVCNVAHIPTARIVSNDNAFMLSAPEDGMQTVAGGMRVVMDIGVFKDQSQVPDKSVMRPQETRVCLLTNKTIQPNEITETRSYARWAKTYELSHPLGTK